MTAPTMERWEVKVYRRLSEPTMGKDSGTVIAPTLLLGNGAWRKIHAYAQLMGGNEINGFAFVKRSGNGLFMVAGPDDVFITQQTVSPGTANVDASVFARALDKAALENRADDLRLQWHSHGYASTYFSSTDLGTIRNYGDAGFEWFLSLVVNGEGQCRARFDQYRPLRIGVEIPVQLCDDVPDPLMESCQADVDAMVSVVELKKTYALGAEEDEEEVQPADSLAAVAG